MTAQSEIPYNQRELENHLIKAGLIESGAEIELTPYATGYLRQAEFCRWHYKITSREQAICHLIIGRSLASVHENAASFFAACPELACRPLSFWQDAKGLDYLTLVHFSGTPLDLLVERGECNATKWVSISQQALQALGKTRRPSSQTKLEEEIARLLKKICALPGMTSLDQSILHEIAVPAVLKGALAEPLFTQWSNGDFCGRNLLVGPQGHTRLIDYEFATETHFSCTDWLRLKHFSVLPPELENDVLKKFSGDIKPWSEIWFWLQQLSLLADAKHSNSLSRHINETVSKAFAAMAKVARSNPGQTSASLLIDRLTAQQDEDRVVLNDRTHWAMSLESELRQALDCLAQQTQLAEEHLAWVRTLEKNLAERTDWTQSLSRELDMTKQNFEKLSQEFAERTAWAKSLDGELAMTKQDFENLAKKSAKYSTHNLSLERDLSAAQADLRREACLNEALTTTAAGLTLTAELQANAIETELTRLKSALDEAQFHVDQLLPLNSDLILRLKFAVAHQQSSDEILLQRESELTAAKSELQTKRVALNRYKNSWLGRLSDLFSSSTTPDSPRKS